MLEKLNNMWIGLLFGLISPIVVLIIFYIINYTHISFYRFLTKYMEYKALVPLFSLCTLINLGLFYIFIQKENYYTARGIILSTLIYAIIVFAYKLS